MPALAVADGELDFARMISRFDQPLSVGRDGVLGREDRDCQEACDEEDGEPQRDPGVDFRSWMGEPPRGLQGALDASSHSSIAESAAVGGPFARTIRADAVTELHVAVAAHVRLELFPAALVGEHALAGGADLDQTLERLDLRDCGLELA